MTGGMLLASKPIAAGSWGVYEGLKNKVVGSHGTIACVSFRPITSNRVFALPFFFTNSGGWPIFLLGGSRTSSH